MEVKKLVESRESPYGSFLDNSRISQSLFAVLMEGENALSLEMHHRHALYMMCMKMSRIVGGNANLIDHWTDIGGYAQCVINTIEQLAPSPKGESKPKPNPSMPLDQLATGEKDAAGEYIP